MQPLVDLAEEIMQRMLHDSSPLFKHLPFTHSSNNGKRNEDFEDVGLKSLEGDKVYNCGIPDISFDKADGDAIWDGISGYITNSKKPMGEVIDNYRRLWVIEDSFRLCKHDWS